MKESEVWQGTNAINTEWPHISFDTICEAAMPIYRRKLIIALRKILYMNIIRFAIKNYTTQVRRFLDGLK